MLPLKQKLMKKNLKLNYFRALLNEHQFICFLLFLILKNLDDLLKLIHIYFKNTSVIYLWKSGN